VGLGECSVIFVSEQYVNQFSLLLSVSSFILPYTPESVFHSTQAPLPPSTIVIPHLLCIPSIQARPTNRSRKLRIADLQAVGSSITPADAKIQFSASNKLKGRSDPYNSRKSTIINPLNVSVKMVAQNAGAGLQLYCVRDKIGKNERNFSI